MNRVGLIGGRGYVGRELLYLFDRIPEYEVVFAGSRSQAGKPVADEFPGLQTRLVFSDVDEPAIQQADADIWILALENGQAADFARRLDTGKCRIVDISADHRFDERWVYGLPQVNETRIAAASRVANPGCYATAIQTGLWPVIDWLDESVPPVAFGVSGFSGAGRSPCEKNDPARLQDNLLPYQLSGHGHERESSFHLKREICFSPHVASFFRGISVTLMVRFAKPRPVDEITDRFRQQFEKWPLLEVVVPPPEIAMVRETGRGLVGGFTPDSRDPCRVVWTSVIDNLRKGAASQAIENINLMCGLPSSTGLMS